MTTVRVLKPFKRRGEIVTPGTILNDVPEYMLPRLANYVEPLDLFCLIGELLQEIHASGRPWTGFHGALTPADRQALRDAEAAIDVAALAGDHVAILKALDSYRMAVREARRRMH